MKIKQMFVGAVAVVAMAGAALFGAVAGQQQKAHAQSVAGYQFMVVSYGGALTVSSVFGVLQSCNDARNESLAGTGAGYTHTACRSVNSY